MLKVYIHGCTLANGDSVLAKVSGIRFYPPGRCGPDLQNAYVGFNIMWNWEDDPKSRENLLASIEQKDGNAHFDLIIGGDDPLTARVGLRPWKDGKSSLAMSVLWAKQGIEPREW